VGCATPKAKTKSKRQKAKAGIYPSERIDRMSLRSKKMIEKLFNYLATIILQKYFCDSLRLGG